MYPTSRGFPASRCSTLSTGLRWANDMNRNTPFLGVSRLSRLPTPEQRAVRVCVKLGIAFAAVALGCFVATQFADHSQSEALPTWTRMMYMSCFITGGTALNCFICSWLFAKRHVTFAMLNTGFWH